MIPASFDYVTVDSADAAIAALGQYGDDAKLLAGGHSLIPLMKLRLATPGVLIDIGRVSDLSYIRDQGDHLAIGALTRHHDIEHSALVQEAAPLLAYATSLVGDPAVRHRGTIGGSLAHSDPASDSPAAILALGATLVATGPGGARQIDAADFFQGFMETSLGADELLTEIRVPKAVGGWSFQKFNRRAQDWAIVGCAVQLGSTPRVAMVNMSMAPTRNAAVEAALAGGSGTVDAAAHAAEGMSPPTDLNGDPVYRAHLARVLVARGIAEAASR